MPDVICNTSVIQYLHQLGLLHLFRELYGSVLVPKAVAREIATGRALGVNLPNLSNYGWITVRAVVTPIVASGELGAGEVAVLSLAVAHPSALVVMDDGLARAYARLAHIRFTGTCGIHAAREGARSHTGDQAINRSARSSGFSFGFWNSAGYLEAGG